jgi:type I restriction enzyme S subunit
VSEIQSPQGWIQTNLGDIVDILDSQRVPLNSKERSKKQGIYPYYGANGKIDYINDYLFDGDYVLLAEDGGYFDSPDKGVAYKVSGKFWVNNHAHILAPLGGMNTQFIVYSLNNMNWLSYVSGTTRLKLTQSSLLKVPFPLPPLNEQYRITEKLDKLMAHHKKAEEALEKIPLLIEKFKQLVLDAAFSGDLTANWREQNPEINDSNPQDLSEFFLEHYSIPESWLWIRLNDLINEIQSGNNFKCSEMPVTKGSVGLVKISAVTWGEFNQQQTKTVEDKSRINPDLFIKKGDFLISRANTMELVGASVIVNNIDYDIMLSDKVWKVVFIEGVNKKYINYYLKSRQGRDEIEKRARGNQVSMKNISQNDFRDIIIPYPSLEEQEKIVGRIEQLFQHIDYLENRYKKMNKELENLKKNIFSKAFRGELVPQDTNDEPASVLVEGIRQEKEKLNFEKQKQRKTKMATKTTKKQKTRRHLTEILSESNEDHLSPEQLFDEAGFDESIVEPFYHELLSAIESEEIEEIRPDNTKVYLSLK